MMEVSFSVPGGRNLQSLWLWSSSNLNQPITTNQFLTAVTVTVVTYYTCRTIYNLYYHPLSKYPGPRLAAVTDLWWVYASTSGRYPWIVEDAIKRYGDVVRIAPNEVVFLTPQAAKDVYLAQERNMELFVQVGYDALDTGDGGISGETNPVKHREIAKKLAPAFNMKNFKAKETAIHKHLDLFIQKMATHSSDEEGIEMRRWTDWLALDLSASLTYNLEMDQVRDEKSSFFLEAGLKLNLFLTLSQVTRKFPLLTPLTYFCIPPSIWPIMPKLIKKTSDDIKTRIRRRGTTPHLDYMDQLIPADQPAPTDEQQIFHLGNIAGQLLLAGWQPLANQFYSVIMFLLSEPDAYAKLVEEVRGAFVDYGDIRTETVAGLRYLHACMQESLRLHQETIDGLPRVSPGAVVDGAHIPEGTVCQISYFAAARSARYFADPLRFRPERWLPGDHAGYDSRFKGDCLKASKPFSQGPRGCPGGAIATNVIRLFVAKVLWEFDLEIGKNGTCRLPDFDRDFRFMTFWERPLFWVRFKPVGRDI